MISVSTIAPNALPWLVRALAVLLASTGMVLAAAPADAQSGYQKGVVKIVVTNAPGTAPDAIGRAIAQGLQEIRGMPVVVESKVGVQGMLGGDIVVRSVADGSTLLLASDTLTTVLPHLPEAMSFDPIKDLKPIAMVADAAYVLVVNPSMKVKTLAEFVKAVKASPDKFDYGSTGPNSAHNRTMVQFMKIAGIKMNEIPYGSTGPLVDVLGGQIPVMWSGLVGALPHIKAGKLIALAVSSPKRHPSLPEVPTADESGYAGFDEVNWFGIMAPAALPDAVARSIQADVLKVVNMPAFKERMIAQGMSARPGTQEEFGKQIRVDYARNKGRIAMVPLGK